MSEKKEIFRTPVSPRKIVETTTGSETEPEWALKLDENGKEVFYIKGYTNTFEKIQAFKDECLIENILAACMDTGDMSLLNRAQGEFMDISTTPANIYEAHRQIKEAEKTFETLPLEIKTKFNNSFNEFMAELGKSTWFEKMKMEKPEVPTENKKEEVKADE